MSVELGLFDILQIDPTDPDDHGAVYKRRLDQLVLADELGLSVAFTAERHFLANYRCPSPVAWLGAASQRTSRIRLGVLGFTLPIHAPVRLAEDISVLDHLSGGRLEVGLGLGHRPEELTALGVDPAERIEVFQEHLAIMEALWSGGEVTIESDHSTVRGVAINPLPLQEPHPPLWYAGLNPGATRWAGERGMNLAVGFAPLRDLVPATAAFKAGVQISQAEPSEGAGPIGGRIALMRHLVLAESDEQASKEMTEDLYRLHSLHADSSGDRVDRRAAAEEERERLVQNEVVIAGNPESVASRIGLAEDGLGVDLFLANVYSGGVDDERIERSLWLLAGPLREALAARKQSAGEGEASKAR